MLIYRLALLLLTIKYIGYRWFKFLAIKIYVEFKHFGHLNIK